MPSLAYVIELMVANRCCGKRLGFMVLVFGARVSGLEFRVSRV